MTAVVERDAPSSLATNLAGYTLLSHLGRGGMADIFAARDRTGGHPGKLVAIKVLRARHASEPRYQRLLADEARLLSSMSHPNIVRADRVVAADGTHALVMEYVESIDMAMLLRVCALRRVRMPLALALCIVRQLLVALAHVHEGVERTATGGSPRSRSRVGVVHRDVSPSNVLVAYDGRVKLCDFGIAVTMRSRVAAGKGTTIEGKAGYMSPEQARGDAVDARSDLFAVGIVLWELLAGRRLYRRRRGAPLLAQAARGAVPMLPARGFVGEEALVAIVSKALAPRRDDRGRSAAAMLRELDGWCLSHGMNASQAQLGSWMQEHFAGIRRARSKRHEWRRTGADAAERTLGSPGRSIDEDGVEIPERSGPRRIARARERLLVAEPKRRESAELVPIGAAAFVVFLALLCVLGWLGAW